MILFTTPITELKIKNVDLTQADSVLVTITQGTKKVEVDDPDVTVEEVNGVAITTVSFHLEQTDTKDFAKGWGKIQVNWLYTENGVQLRDATVVKKILFGEQLHPSVLLEVTT